MQRSRRVPPAALLSLAIAAVAAGCGPAEVPAGGPAITGSHPLVRWSESGAQALGVERSDELFIEAQLDGAGGPETRPAALADDGTFRIAGSPPSSSYWLRTFDGSRTREDVYLWTGATTLDLGHDVAGRDRVERARSRETRLVVDAPGLAPLEEQDQFDFVLANLGYASAGVHTYYSTNNPELGESALTHLTLDWAGFPLAEAAAGDRAFFVQLRPAHAEALGIDFLTPIRAFHSEPFSIREGATSTLSSTFTEVAPLAFPLAWARSAFAGLRTAIHPTRADEPTDQAFWVHANPAGASHGDLLDDAPRVIENVTLPPGTTDLVGTLAAGNPYPAGALLAKYELTFPVHYAAPEDEAVTNDLLAQVGVVTDRFGSAEAPVVPLVGPVGAPLVNGQDLFARAHGGVGLTPTISWTRPSVGSATSYELHLLEAVVQHHYVPRVFTTLVFHEDALLLVPGEVTSVRLPRELLQDGVTYLLRIRAVARPGEHLASAPFRASVPVGYADLCTGYFAP